ncbi:MAG: preprotein translocase subunit SecY, partial [Ruminiclostridium sp.]
MFQVFRNAWKDLALRKKILFTLLIIVIFRLGAAIFVPFLDPAAIKELVGEGTILNYLDVMTGGSLSNGTLFAMSITPYINASIIVQLLTVAIPALERLSKEGEEGRKKINKITKYVALGIGLFQAIAFYIGLRNVKAVRYTDGFDGILAAITIVACFVAGASLIIWLGDLVSQKGIGNGISMILFAGIISRTPDMIITLINQISVQPQNWFFVPLILVIYVV